MSPASKLDFALLYAGFNSPIGALDCGDRCAPYNERGVPFCCDTRHVVPTAYLEEWRYLRANSDLWHLWQADDPAVTNDLREQAPDGQVLIECLGHTHCQRDFRSLACRSFPFFPYITSQGEFIGLSYYWEYQDRCWVISNLDVVTPAYLAEFIAAYETLFEYLPAERENFQYHSAAMREAFGNQRRAVPVLHRSGNWYRVSPHTGRKRRVEAGSLPKFDNYKIAAEMPFPDEI